jgi:phosphoglycerate dehydrogenase-like enzyme
VTVNHIVFLDDYQGAVVELAPLDRLRESTWESVRTHLDGDELVAALAGADVVVAMRERTVFDSVLFDRLPKMRLLCTTGAHNASIDLSAAAAAGVVVSACQGRPSGATTELTWALILATLRHVPTEVADVARGGWQATIGTDLGGTTLGLVGLGRIGARMAEVGRAFGMEVIAWSQNLDAARASEHQVRAVTKDELFATADVVSIHLVLSARTRGLVGAAELRAMKPGAVLVNTSRGPIVDEAGLLRALDERWIAGAGLDVFDVEPLPAGHPLRTHPRAIVTPHLGYVTTTTLRQWYDDIVEDVTAWQAGAPIRVLSAGS